MHALPCEDRSAFATHPLPGSINVYINVEKSDQPKVPLRKIKPKAQDYTC